MTSIASACEPMSSSASAIASGFAGLGLPEDTVRNIRKMAAAMQLMAGMASGYAAINAAKVAWNQRQAALAAAETAAFSATGIGLKNVALAAAVAGTTSVALMGIVRTITVDADMRMPGGAMAELGVELDGR